MPADIAAQIDALLREHEPVPTPCPPAEPVRDPDDRWVVAAAIAAKADVSVTGDRDLLDIAKQVPIEIVDPRSFWHAIRES